MNALAPRALQPDNGLFVVRVGTVQLIRGRLRPVVQVYVEGPNFANRLCPTTVDTGFSEYLTLPGHIVDYLGLSPAGFTEARMANDQVQRFDLFHAEVIFGSRTQNILVHRTESESLVGMSLLSGSVIKIDARLGGAVELEPVTGPV